MDIKAFKLERYFAIHEFSAKYLLSSSDCDGLSMQYLLDLASKEDLNRWQNLQLGYTDSAGDPQLREAISTFYQNVGLENIVVASPGELNFITMNLLLQKGDHAIVMAPAYQSLYEIARSLSCELSYWQPRDNWHYEPEDLRAYIKPNTKLIIINFPHNPTGAYPTLAEFEEIISIAKANDLYLFSDEMYAHLETGELPKLPPVQDLYEKGISLWGSSKSFGLAGLRIGWMVSQDKVFIKRLGGFKDYLSICNNAPSEILTLIALKNADTLINDNINKIKANIKRFSKFADQHSLIKGFIPPKAGSTAFVELDIEGTALNFSDHLVKETGIMTVPAEMFEYPGKFIRVGFGRANFSEALARFQNYLEGVNT